MNYSPMLTTDVCSSLCPAPAACPGGWGGWWSASFSCVADYSPCLVHLHFLGFASVQWVQTLTQPPLMLLFCSLFVLQQYWFSSFPDICRVFKLMFAHENWSSSEEVSAGFVGIVQIWRWWWGLRFRNLKALHIVNMFLHRHISAFSPDPRHSNRVFLYL